MTGAPSKQARGTLPPWLWFWLIIFVFTVPGVISFTRQSLEVLLSYGEMSAGIVTALHVFFLSNLPQLITALALMLGILTILVPWTRAARLERRFRLSEPRMVSPAVKEIESFVQAHAPGLRTKTNLLRADQLAFVYPLGYRSSALALFGGIVRLWRSDRRAAEAVLLHEVAHHRHGDALILGAGSYFETLARYWLVLCVPPVVLAIADFATIFYTVGAGPGGAPLTTFFGVAVFVVPVSFLAFVGVLFWLVSALALPLIGGIWSAELNADRFVVNSQGSPEDLVRALDTLPPERSWWRWFLFRMFHPPQGLRRRAALWSGGEQGLVMLLLIFPLLYPAKLLAMSAWALCLYMSTCVLGCGSFDLWGELGANIGYAWERNARILFAMTALLIAWPMVTGYWEQLFSGKKGADALSVYRAYVIVALASGVFFATSYALRFFG